ncbi:hypothetical protein ACWT_5634 [Actinoplanes sp. SE50]|uniref:roadblock/LC7 domain-containing protein n=1 Tax=unclassified Actinoplanes TaxID=2626549 RepID=UPI00023ED0FE|nr:MULTISPECIES: hypothetical protein [unclassified Actinoplanes]AEV86651.1 hypothetical protein ACPL_5764 [Actinoplanes sp. SE50/110]ATO85049.1 hypothetical protein ACWT_5634 [Actinoplanes sp. SE50]SLM02459.1 hypothetical protein ACSP50_5709 [Actinoplanes sp. SE50/110]
MLDDTEALADQPVRGWSCVGLLMFHDTTTGIEPHDVAALAAGAHGISRTTGAVLGQGGFTDVTMHHQNDHLTVYGIGEPAPLVVIGEGGLNIARLHLEARPVTNRLSEILQICPAHHR